MKALTYQGTKHVRVENVPDPVIQQADDIILRVTATAIDAVGMESKRSASDAILTTIKAETSSGASLRQCIAATRRGGHVSVPGVYAGFIQAFMFGDAFEKGLTLKMGQTHVQRFFARASRAHRERRSAAGRDHFASNEACRCRRRLQDVQRPSR